jgi:hypothetical protein
MKLNLGCGQDIREGYVNIDSSDRNDGVDIVANLNHGIPIDSNNLVDEVIAFHIIEHIRNTLRIMAEIHRVCKNGALVYIKIPYWNDAGYLDDPTHCRYLTMDTFIYFTKSHANGYSHITGEFEIVEKRLLPRGKLGKLSVYLAPYIRNICKEAYIVLKVIK